ncbi:896_t:CDS:2, partial [Racocetra fulgida]
AKNNQLDSKKAIETIFVQDINDYIITLNIIGTNDKAMATIIVNKIENSDRYNWTATTFCLVS